MENLSIRGIDTSLNTVLLNRIAKKINFKKSVAK